MSDFTTTMSDYTTRFTVAQTPEEVVAAITNTRGWWSGAIEGNTDTLGAEFTYDVPGVHWSKQKITALEAGRRVAWDIMDSDLRYTKAHEWTGTHVTFDIEPKEGTETEVRFSHFGLVPSFECYGDCSNAWDALVNGNLKRLIETGETQPSPW
jgi:hypothetical protein